MASWAAEGDHDNPDERKSKIKVRAVGSSGNRGVGEVNERGPRNPEGKDVLLVVQPHVEMGVRSERMGGD
jgi:hypothetical protein